MRRRVAALVWPLLCAASTMACLVDFGCDDGRFPLEKSFFREPARRVERFRRYALPEQYKIFRYGMTREPPDFELTEPIAEHGSVAVPFFLEQLNGTPDDETVKDVLLIFEAMARLKTYDVRGDAAVMTTLTSKASTMKDKFWKAEAAKTLKSIKGLP